MRQPIDIRPLEETWTVGDPEEGGIVAAGEGYDSAPQYRSREIVQTDSGYYLRSIDDMYLIAAAPELYRALLAMVDNEHRNTMPDEVLRAAVDALAKARGDHRPLPVQKPEIEAGSGVPISMAALDGILKQALDGILKQAYADARNPFDEVSMLSKGAQR